MQFIKVYENALSEQLIQELINWADLPDTELSFGLVLPTLTAE